MQSNPEKVIFNFYKYELSHPEKKLFAKGLNFCLAPKQLNYTDYLVHFELFYRNIRNLKVLSNKDLDFVETKAKETALSSFRQYNKSPLENFSKEELTGLASLSKNKDIAIRYSDKANSVGIVDKETYIKNIKRMKKI